ncbi:MAG TPA: Ppx/GppA family phosphatase [Bacteroidetes bacterium]|nr:Ppx/GppA family phosphatase [Bacteroidota bacterium]
MRLGVIDCGTNTFHLLVADVEGSGEIKTVLRQREYVRLGEDGLEKIGKEPFRRGVQCLAGFKQKLETSGVEKLKVFGTEALRRATNGKEFVRAVKAETGIKIQLISGEEEARLIQLGVMQAVPPFEGKGLIMDIGGGSVEFIITNGNRVLWAKSFPIGVQVLFSKFHNNDPISQQELRSLETYFEDMLQPLSAILKVHKTPTLLGASGSFEVIEDLLFEQRRHPLYSIVPVEDYYKIHPGMISSTIAERRAMKKLPEQRVELTVVAFSLVGFILKKAGIRQIITSTYAMKEGVLLEMANGK